MSQSAIAWFEDVDIALLKEIRDSVYYIKNGKRVQLPEKNVIVRKPEEDYKIEVYPCVSIYNLSYSLDRQTYYQYAKRGKTTTPSEKEGVAGTVSYHGDNIPFKLQYQIDFWARYQSDINEMTKSWLTGHVRQFNLPIESDEGFSCNCIQEGNVTKADMLAGLERAFHTIISYSIWVEIEDERVYTKFRVEGVTLDTRKL